MDFPAGGTSQVKQPQADGNKTGQELAGVQVVAKRLLKTGTCQLRQGVKDRGGTMTNEARSGFKKRESEENYRHMERSAPGNGAEKNTFVDTARDNPGASRKECALTKDINGEVGHSTSQ